MIDSNIGAKSFELFSASRRPIASETSNIIIYVFARGIADKGGFLGGKKLSNGLRLMRRGL
jgi:hypothetical protein